MISAAPELFSSTYSVLRPGIYYFLSVQPLLSPFLFYYSVPLKTVWFKLVGFIFYFILFWLFSPVIYIHLVDRLFSKKSLHGPVHPGAALLLLLLAIAREEPSCHRVRGFFSLASSISFHSLPYTHSLLPFRSFSILLAVPTDSDPPLSIQWSQSELLGLPSCFQIFFLSFSFSFII